jgi:hypothetical protein
MQRAWRRSPMTLGGGADALAVAPAQHGGANGPRVTIGVW